MTSHPILQARNISKTFPGVVALDRVNISFHAGEVHALVGENGAGKSTLLNVLTGVYKPDSGASILFNGEEVHFSSTEEALNLGISMIHQENSLVQHLTVYENIFLGHFIKKGIFIDKGQMIKNAQQLLNRLNISHIKSTSYLKDLSPSERQLIEIAKALSKSPKVIFMDEPTAALTVAETRILMNIVHDLRENGCAVVFISHHLEEIFEIADVCTVLRDGQLIETLPIKELDIPKLITMMVGRKLDDNIILNHAAEADRRRKSKNNEVVLEVKDVSYRDQVTNASFVLHEGEILGFAGLVGSGRSELMECVYGYKKMQSGSIRIDNSHIIPNNPSATVKRGMGMVTEDRKLNGILPRHSVRDNVNSAYWRFLRNGMFISKRKERKNAQAQIDSLNIKAPSQDTKIISLSGGNQQKALLGRMLSIAPRILILDEPTKGIDVGAKAEIYQIINQLSEKGISIILISSQLPELISLSHRILVMHEGEIVGGLEYEDFDQESIMNLASGIVETA